jgi:hypothetical protein
MYNEEFKDRAAIAIFAAQVARNDTNLKPEQMAQTAYEMALVLLKKKSQQNPPRTAAQSGIDLG